MVIAGLNAFRSGNGEPLVLISPFWHAWDPVLPRLTRDFDVVAVDLPGFGASPLATRESASVPAMADAVGVVLSELGFGAAHIAANSLGASVGLELGRRGLARTITAIAPLGLGTRRESRRTARRLAIVRSSSRLAGPLVPLAARTVAGRTLFAGAGLHLARPWRHEREAMLITVRDYLRADGFRPAVDWVLKHEPARLDGIRCRTVIAWGSRDRIASPRQAQRWADRIPGAELCILPGAGHVAMSDDADGVADLVLATARSTLAA